MKRYIATLLVLMLLITVSLCTYAAGVSFEDKDTSISGVSLMSIEATAETSSVTDSNSVVLKIYTSPIELQYAFVDWSVSWVNPSSSWASGKNVNQYVSVIPDSENNITATVNCLQAFGEQVKITANLTDFDLKASCTCDYKQSVISDTLTLNHATNNQVLYNAVSKVFNIDAFAGAVDCSYPDITVSPKVSYESTPGTLKLDSPVSTLTVSCNPAFFDYMKTTPFAISSIVTKTYQIGSTINFHTLFWDFFLGKISHSTSNEENVREIIGSYPGNALDITLSIKFTDYEYISKYSVRYTLNVSSAQMSRASIVFG